MRGMAQGRATWRDQSLNGHMIAMRFVRTDDTTKACLPALHILDRQRIPRRQRILRQMLVHGLILEHGHDLLLLRLEHLPRRPAVRRLYQHTDPDMIEGIGR